MRLAISNIAWDIAEDEVIAVLLQQFGIDAIDIAPGKYFSDPIKTTTAEIIAVKKWWAERGIGMTGMQALLFGTVGLNIFSTQEIQNAMLRQLSAVCRIGSVLGAKKLVFGSPKNRDRSGIDEKAAIEIATSFFYRLADIANSQGVVICLEPNPARYGANFMTNTIETLQVVKQINHPAIRMQLDTGALAINGESIATVLDECAPYIGHIHASEPDLVPLGDGGVEHSEIAAGIRSHLQHHVISIEMLATKNEAHEVSIMRALTTAIRHYRSDNVGRD